GWYTRTGGIWQTVYLESRPESEILPSQIVPDIDKSEARFHVPLHLARDGAYQVRVNATHENRTFSSTHQLTAKRGEADANVTILIPNSALWTPETPALYDATIELLQGAKVI